MFCLAVGLFVLWFSVWAVFWRIVLVYCFIVVDWFTSLFVLFECLFLKGCLGVAVGLFMFAVSCCVVYIFVAFSVFVLILYVCYGCCWFLLICAEFVSWVVLGVCWLLVICLVIVLLAIISWFVWFACVRLFSIQFTCQFGFTYCLGLLLLFICCCWMWLFGFTDLRWLSVVCLLLGLCCFVMLWVVWLFDYWFVLLLCAVVLLFVGFIVVLVIVC